MPGRWADFRRSVRRCPALSVSGRGELCPRPQRHPKIVAILIGAKAVGVQLGLFSIGVAMALGGLLGARRVAETMAKRS